MRISIEELIAKCALLMGETPSNLISGEESCCATLADRIALEIELKAAQAVAATPREELTGWRLLDDAGLTELEDGSALLPLPSDFLMLHTLRLSGWERSVTEVAAADTLAARLQSGRWEGLRGTPERPVAVLTPRAAGMSLRLYGAHNAPPAVEEGWYMPVPRADSEGYIDLPEAALPRLLEAIRTMC